MKRVLITGGCGFVGSALAVDLVGRGYAVTVLDNLSRRGAELILQQRILPGGIQFVQGDVRNVEDMAGLDQEFVALVECSAEPSVLAGTGRQGARYLLDVNLQGAINCFDWARERAVPVIFMSTSRVYPYDRLNACRYREAETRFELVEGCRGVGPGGVSVEMEMRGVRSLYGASKLCAELILQEYSVQHDMPAIINRCGVIAGPWQMGKIDQGVFTYWLARHYFKQPLGYIGFGGTGKQVRDLLHVQDVAALIARQLESMVDNSQSYRGEVFNVGGSVAVNLSLREATVICQDLTGNRMQMGCVEDTRPADLMWYLTDNGRTESVFKWKPQKTARDILQDTYDWLRSHDRELGKIFLNNGA